MHTSSGKVSTRLIALLAVLITLAAIGYANTHSAASTFSTLPVPVATAITQAPVVSELPSASCHARGLLPDATCTPGVASPNVTQANLSQTICVRGYTKTVRPPVSYTDKLKAQQMLAYGYTDSLHLHEEDHLISLELGGDPSDPKNLWPEPGLSPNPKDKVENALHAAVCSGRISLKDAQDRIATDWTTAEQGL